MLLGTDDVVYFRVPDDMTAERSVAMWGDPSNNNDFDIYVRCNAPPTPTVWDYRGYSVGAQEFLHLPQYGCPVPPLFLLSAHAECDFARIFAV